ncbi:MAG: DUF4389 domain-containing protein [Dehalococcoidia bacterium]|nr:DUF4389 domain-containing protein [Dehalococcoidia bacterium]
MINYPISVSIPEPQRLSRWRVFFKSWLFIVPHLVALALLWVAMLMATAVALPAVLVTGRYPRRLFDFVVGVNRWGFRVAVYAALLRDEYPPFSLGGPYPATFEVVYAERLSQRLGLVKWWLLAIPHYLILYLLYKLLLLLVLFLGIFILFKGRPHSQTFSLVRGILCWYARVGAYVTLLTDEYPPFSLQESRAILVRQEQENPSTELDGLP